jgi:hypothetical protein
MMIQTGKSEMSYKHSLTSLILVLLLTVSGQRGFAQEFVHPGGCITTSHFDHVSVTGGSSDEKTVKKE